MLRRDSIPGRFQPYHHTLPNRYPWLFEFAAAHLDANSPLQVLSFGCSRGDEVFSLRQHLPGAHIKGIDIDPGNVALCQARARDVGADRVTFAVAATADDEQSESYDALFCLAVLCHGDLTGRRARRCDPLLRFADFERIVASFAQCLKPGGLLFLHTSNFRFGDTQTASGFDTVLECDCAELAPDAVFDRNNQLLEGVRYLPVGFRKRPAPGI